MCPSDPICGDPEIYVNQDFKVKAVNFTDFQQLCVWKLRFDTTEKTETTDLTIQVESM